MADDFDNVTTRRGRRTRPPQEGGERDEQPTSGTDTDSSLGECIVRLENSVDSPARAIADSDDDEESGLAQSRGEQEDAPARESGKRAADGSLMVDLSPAVETASASSGSVLPAAKPVPTLTDPVLQERNRKRPAVSDLAPGPRFSVKEDLGDGASGHPADRSGGGTHSRTPPVAESGLAPPQSGVEGETILPRQPPIHAVGDSNAPVQQLEQAELSQAASEPAARAREQREGTALPQHSPRTLAESPAGSTGTHRSPSREPPSQSADRLDPSGTHRRDDSVQTVADQSDLSGTHRVDRMVQPDQRVRQSPGQGMQLPRQGNPPIPRRGAASPTLRNETTASSGIVPPTPAVPVRPIRGPGPSGGSGRRLPAVPQPQYELLRMDAPSEPDVVTAEEIEQWRRDMSSLLDGADHSRQVSHLEEGTHTGILLSPSPDSPDRGHPAPRGVDNPRLVETGSVTSGERWALPRPLDRASRAHSREQLLSPPIGDPPPYERLVTRAEFSALRATVAAGVTRVEHIALQRLSATLQGLSEEASRHRLTLEERLTAAERSIVQNHTALTDRLTALEDTSKETVTKLDNLSQTLGAKLDANTEASKAILELLNARPSSQDASTTVNDLESQNQASAAPIAQRVTEQQTNSKGSNSQKPRRLSPLDEGFGEDERSPSPYGAEFRPTSTPSEDSQGACGGVRPKDPKPRKGEKPFSVPSGCTPDGARRKRNEAARVCPRYSEIFPPNRAKDDGHGCDTLETPEEETPAVVQAPAPAPVAVVAAPVVPPAETTVAAEQTGTGRVKPRIPRVANKPVWEYIGWRYAEDQKDRTLPLFITMIECAKEDEDWDDETTALGARSALTGRAHEIVAQMRGTPGYNSWDAVKAKLVAEMYGRAKQMSAETSLDKSTREENETLRTFAKKIRNFVDQAYFKRPIGEREEKACKAFLSGIKHAELEFHLRSEQSKRSDLDTLNALVAEGEAFQNLVLQVKGSKPIGSTIARVAPPDAKKTGRQPSDAAPKGRGRGKKKGPKPVAPYQQKSSSPGGRQMPPCRGKCWRCGTPGHRFAECPGGKVCSARAGPVPCPQGENDASCECECSGHTHFGYGGGVQCSER